ncbi:ornithine carbamoyltransferase [Paenibacillus hexagrammi]|uniref:Ornithine carbamoyltransferase n=1 Tax=Paenibacillus hexagrammi TaxID=2908839 RepID=A0ABY3SGB5_9BACL|nr:ornithine carbamoyltransferase [Paenibacillus sp. YPD9-1]UJF32966.1 ornithine carbamoyltransferase [Paenibacillus sp. YPD9-1]
MNLLDINELSSDDIYRIFSSADEIKSGMHENFLKGKTFVLFFPESSIRTRITFEIGIKSLGGDCIMFPSEALDKKEELKDVIKYIENWAHGVIVRHADFSKIRDLASHSKIPVINAMTSVNHPCEVLSDLYAISKRKEHFQNLSYTFVGPAGNICRSWLTAAEVLDFKFNHVCLKGHELRTDSDNYQFYTELDEIIKVSEVVLTDSLPDEFRNEQYIAEYQVTLERMKLAPNGALLNPCPPFFRAMEVSEEVISSEYFVGYTFKKDLLFVQQAIIIQCLLN